MSGQAIQFFAQILPIAIGALFLLLLRGVKLPESGIRVRFSGEIPESAGADRKENDADAREPATGLPVRCQEIHGSRELGEVVAIYHSPPSQHLVAYWHGYLGGSEDMRALIFERFVYDELITNGIFNPRTRSQGYHEIAFEKLRILDVRNAEGLRKYLKRQKSGKLRLFACGSPSFIRRTLSFNGGYGLFMAYLMGYDLEVIGA